MWTAEIRDTLKSKYLRTDLEEDSNKKMGITQNTGLAVS